MSDEYQNKINLLEKKISRQEQYIIPGNFGPLPNRKAIIEISKQLRLILFPGYFGKKNFEGEIRE